MQRDPKSMEVLVPDTGSLPQEFRRRQGSRSSALQARGRGRVFLYPELQEVLRKMGVRKGYLPIPFPVFQE